MLYPSSAYLVSNDASFHRFQSSFDRSPFAFAHQFQSLEQFSYDALVRLARRVSGKPKRWYVEEGETLPETGWSGGQGNHSLLEVLENIASNHSLVILKRVHEEPEYGEILNHLEEELSRLTGIDIASRYSDPIMTVLINSPLRITPYHIDGEANLLMQVRGTKSVYIFDGEDHEVLPVAELEGFWSGNIRAPKYKRELQSRAWRFDLAPGDGVMNPVIFPHWVQNGPDVSISLSTNFKRVSDDKADAYRVNQRLRRIGLHPTEPGAAPSMDHMKGAIYRTARRVKRCVEHLSKTA